MPRRLYLAPLLAALLALPPRPAYGQAAFRFSNYNPQSHSAPICDGNGIPLAGSNYLADIVVGRTPDSLQPVYQWIGDSATPLIPKPFSVANPGYFLGTSVVSMNVQPGDLAWIQVRAWDARLGVTYDAVRVLDVGGYGESDLFQERGAAWSAGFVPTPLDSLQSFSLLPVVPEPSPAWLLLLGLPWLICWHRRKAPGKGSISKRQRTYPQFHL